MRLTRENALTPLTKKNSRAIIVLAAFLLVEGCSTPTATVPKVPEDHWSIDGDLEKNPGVVLHKGVSKDLVQEQLGRPKHRSRPNKSDPDVELLYYERKVPGPLVQKTHSDGAGTITVRQQMVYIDKITLTFRQGVLEAVNKDRTMEEDNYGTPKFH